MQESKQWWAGRKRPVFFWAALLLAALPLPRHVVGAMLLPTAPLQIAGIAIQVELANTPESRQRGLMYRTSLPPDQGMLFVFDTAEVQCFWMKNTPLPLSIAFIDSQGIITSIADMQPLSEDPHCSSVPVRRALEMEQGWFARYGIAAGQTIEGLPP